MRKREKGAEKIIEVIMPEDFPKLIQEPNNKSGKFKKHQVG